MNMLVLWIILTILFLVIELITVGMVSIWFMAGALVALVTASLGAPLWLQIVLFIAVSVICFAILYPKLKNSVVKRSQATNADMVFGKTCVVTQRIDNIAGTGAVSVDGKVWTARTVNGEVAEEGTLVQAEEIQGVKLLVIPLSQ